jgi:hypothetical protein
VGGSGTPTGVALTGSRPRCGVPLNHPPPVRIQADFATVFAIVRMAAIVVLIWGAGLAVIRYPVERAMRRSY